MDQVEEIKQKTDIVQVIGEYVSLKKAGRNFKGLCPFHGEKSPSFMVNPELQVFKCFGCSEGGDVYTFLQKIEGMSFGEVLQNLAKRLGITLDSYKPTPGEQGRDRLYQMHNLLTEAYHFLLTKHQAGKAALEYLKGRKVTDEAIEKFKIGYVPDRWDFAVEFLTKKKDFKLMELEQGGLVVKTYDRFRNRIMFPLANTRGQVVGFAGRVMPGADEKAGGKYINSPETEIYHKGDMLYGFDAVRSEIKRMGFAIVVEGEIDMIASWQAGTKNTVALKGTAFTLRQVEMLRRVCDTVVLALDADMAGDSAARRGMALADKAGLSIKVARLTKKDPGDLATQEPEVWKKTIDEAVGIYDYYLESAVERYGLEVNGKKKIGEELLPIWTEIADEIVKAHYIQKLADTLEVRDEDIRAQMAKHHQPSTNKTTDTNKQSADSPKVKTRQEVVEEYMVGLALRGGKTEVLTEVQALIKTPFWKKVITELEIAPTINQLPNELKGRVQDLMMSEEELTRDKWQQEWKRAKEDLEVMDIREQIEKSDGTDLVKLTKRLGELTKSR